MEILKADLNDLNSVFSLESEYFSHPYSKELIYNTLKDKNYLVLIAKDKNEVSGYAEFGYFIDSVCVDRICVKDSFRRLGVAKALLSEGEKWAVLLECEQMTLEVRSRNYKAVSLYENSGYTLCSKRPRYYKNPNDDALIYTKSLKKEQIKC